MVCISVYFMYIYTFACIREVSVLQYKRGVDLRPELQGRNQTFLKNAFLHSFAYGRKLPNGYIWKHLLKEIT